MSAPPKIVGVAETPYARRPGPGSTLDLLAEAARSALVDAGLGSRDVDGLAVSSFTIEPDHAVDVAWRLGLRLRWLMEDTNGGASGLNMLQHGLRAIEAGDAESVLVLAGDRFGAGDFERLAARFNSATRDHLAPIPHGGPNSLFALLTRRHMATHGLGRETYAGVVIAQREWARLNPAAVYREPLTLEQYLAAPLISDPLCRYDCVPVVSGADAVVLAARGPGVAVRALTASFNADDQEGDGLQTPLAELAPALWEAAGLGPEEVDLACIYDDYPAMVLVQLADLGFAERDGLARFVGERIASRTLPVNTSGGQLSAGQAGAAGGLHGLVEATRQLLGRAGERQVRNARAVVVTGYGMVAYRYGACSNAAVLGVDG